MKSISSVEGLGIEKNAKVLVFMPHPDDEAVFMSGFLKIITTNKIGIRVVTFTAGEKSTLRYGLSPEEDLAKARRKELLNSFRILGVKNFEVLSFPDGGLKNKKSEMKIEILKQISEYKPSHVVTFEPDGIYGHPDHIALSEAVSGVTKKPIQLLYVTIVEYKVKPKASSMAEREIHPLKPDFCLRLGLRERLAKLKTLRAHKSQFNISQTKPNDFNFFKVNRMLDCEYFGYRDK